MSDIAERYLKPDAPDWLREIVTALQPQGEGEGAVVLVQRMSNDAIEAYERALGEERKARGGENAEIAPIVFPIALRVFTNPAVLSGARTGAGWVLRGGAAAAGVDAYNKIKGIFS